MKKKVCRTCKLFVEEDFCPICKRDSFTTSWEGHIHFLDVEKSSIAHEINIARNGEYAIKVR